MGEAASIIMGNAILVGAEAELIQRCRGGDQAAFESLVKRHERRIFGLIHQIVRSSKDVEDIAQEVFVKLYFSLPKFRMDSSFDAWLYRITVNQCYDFLRKEKRHAQVTISELTEEDASRFESLESTTQATPMDFDKTLEARQIADRLLGLIHPRDRMLLVLKEVEQLSIEELADVFGTSRSAIKLRLFRARRQLQAACEKGRKRLKRKPSHETS